MNQAFILLFENYRDELIQNTELFFNHPLDGYSLLSGGKYIRSSLFFSANDQTEENIRIAFLLELIHAASLIHDDIIDESSLRRGKSTLFHELGTAKSSALGYYFLSELQKELLKQDPRFYRICFSVLEDMCLGQILEIARAGSLNFSIKQYLDTIGLKTASLFRLSCGWIDSSYYESEANFGYLFGQVFQIADDIQDFCLPEERTGKPIRQDQTVGVITLPTLLAKLHHKESVNKAILRESIQYGINILDKAQSQFPKRNKWKEQLKLTLQEVSSQLDKHNDCSNNSPSSSQNEG